MILSISPNLFLFLFLILLDLECPPSLRDQGGIRYTPLIKVKKNLLLLHYCMPTCLPLSSKASTLRSSVNSSTQIAYDKNAENSCLLFKPFGWQCHCRFIGEFVAFLPTYQHSRISGLSTQFLTLEDTAISTSSIVCTKGMKRTILKLPVLPKLGLNLRNTYVRLEMLSRM